MQHITFGMPRAEFSEFGALPDAKYVLEVAGKSRIIPGDSPEMTISRNLLPGALNGNPRRLQA